MGTAKQKSNKESKTAARVSALNRARMVSANDNTSSSPLLSVGSMNFATVVGILFILCQRLPRNYVLVMVCLCTAILYLFESRVSAVTKSILSMAMKFGVGLATYALVVEQQPELEVYARCAIAGCGGFGVCYASELLLRHLREGLSITSRMAEATQRDLERRGKVGRHALKLAQREARALATDGGLS